jgi:hypothetical protein
MAVATVTCTVGTAGWQVAAAGCRPQHTCPHGCLRHL